ncbi:unnamed protein product [Ilex paraguariensis]|uniref:Uncharacterized protein n=1 Tax=Ilex paraguariensis TaxID=185542 RepID=A0ABC8V211_9AQUA
MDLTREELRDDGEGEDMEREPLAGTHLKENKFYRTRYPGAVRQKAYIFDGEGNYYNKEWDLMEGSGQEFCWYHVELPKGNQKLSQSAQYLIDVLCPPLKLQDILSLVSNGPFCGHVDGALVFRVNSPGPASSKFTFRIAARVTENSVITVSLGRVPRLGFSPVGQSLLSEIPSVESPNYVGDEQKDRGGTVIREHVLDFLLTMNHSEEADNPVPKSVSNLLVHIIDTHVDHLQDVVTKLEIELDSVELELDKDGALVFRVNSPGPASSKFTFRIAARVTENSVITVSLGRVPRLGFSPVGQSLLSEIPSVESPNYVGDEQKDRGGTVIREHVLDFLLTMNHSEEADNPVPKSVSNLLVHIIDTHVDHLQDVVTKLEIELDSVELELDKGGFTLKKQMLDDRRFPKMHADLQRLLQVIANGEQVFPRVREKCSSKNWFASEDISSLEELIGRLRRLKENVGFIANRVTAIQAGLDSWQAEQINRKLYYLSFLSIIFLPLSVITGVFGMNVGGVPWTEQRNPKVKEGFRNVMFVCFAMLLLVLLCFLFPALYTRIAAWRRRRALRRSWSLNRKSFLKRTVTGGDRGGYLRI